MLQKDGTNIVQGVSVQFKIIKTGNLNKNSKFIYLPTASPSLTFQNNAKAVEGVK